MRLAGQAKGSSLGGVPVARESTYRSPFYLPNAHLQTILPNVTRRRIQVNYRRERFELPDTDFIDVDWLERQEGEKAERCCVVLHGLEGDSQAAYIKSLGKSFVQGGYAVAAFNMRGCSGEPNRLMRSYHSGDTEGLAIILNSLNQRYEWIGLAGFSLGGNVVLKYLGERGSKLPSAVKTAVAFSTPCDLRTSADRLARSENAFYMKRFIKLLCSKLKEKEKKYPEYEYKRECSELRTFKEFDDIYTAPLNGFRDAEDYWRQCSSRFYLNGIERPSLLINARNDPFLSEECYPEEEANTHDFLYLETPNSGGHCGFPGDHHRTGYWHERRALEFFRQAG